ncbi:MAG: DUF1361 domain-containing protein [Chitinophagales bacterium]|nr:DUF1361 domain-containing protein [Chitinophagales bacterium]
MKFYLSSKQNFLVELLILAVSMAFSVLLSMVRVYFSHSIMYFFLNWNLLLAFIPYVVALMLPDTSASSKRYGLVLLGVWLLFFPNTFYIITDLFHLRHVRSVPLWFDTLLIVSYAWNGIVLGCLSLRRVQVYLRIVYGELLAFMGTIAFLMLASFGIYLGRYQRWNSWDIIAQPVGLFWEIFQMLRHPFHHLSIWMMICLIGTFLCLCYFTFLTVAKVGSSRIER